jgi:HEAT repeat protein
VALAAIEGLRALADPVLGDVLVEALGHPDEEVVKEVLSAIAESRGGRTVSRLSVGLSHPAWDVRRHAAQLLAAHGGSEARTALETRAKAEEDELVREALARALEDAP